MGTIGGSLVGLSPGRIVLAVLSTVLCGFLAFPAAASARCSAGKSGEVLTVTGDGKRNVAKIVDAGAQVTVDCDQISGRVFSDVVRIRVVLRGGNDSLSYSSENAALDMVSRTVVAKLGPAVKRNVASFELGSITGGNLALNVVGGKRNDQVAFALGNLAGGSKVSIDAALGRGADPSSIAYNGTIIGASTEVAAVFRLGPGNNRFTTTTKTGFFISNNSGQRLRQTIIGSARPKDRDRVTAFFHGRVDSRLDYNVNLRAGNDVSTVSTTYNLPFGVTAFGGRMRVNVDGGPGNDRLIVNHKDPSGTDVPGGNGAFVHGAGGLLELLLTGGAGNDTIDVDLGSGGLDIAAGALLRIRATGDRGIDDPGVPGRDAISVLAQAAPNSNTGTPADVELLVSGDDGNDGPLRLNFVNDATTAFASIFQEIDGGFGRDSCGGTALRARCEIVLSP
jgi:hypothetical protein